MRISLVKELYPPFVGGGEVILQHLAEGLVRKGFDVDVITSSLPGALKEEVLNGVSIHRMPSPSRFLFPLTGLQGTKWVKRSDLVHVFPFVALPLGYAYKKICKRPLLATFYELFFDKWKDTDGKLKGSFFQFAESLFTKLSYDKCAALSQYTLSCMKSAGMDAEKISVVYPGIDEAFFRDVKPAESVASLGNEIYMYFGRPGTSKGLNFLIEASKIVHDERPGSALVLMLSSEPAAYRKKIIEMSTGLDWIKIIPSVPHSEMPAYIAASNVVVLPSISEGFCLTAAEASAQGKAVVATTAGALPEVIKDRETGLLVPPANSGALAKAIIALLEDRSRRESLGRNGRKYVKRFTWDNMVEGYAKLYSGMCK